MRADPYTAERIRWELIHTVHRCDGINRAALITATTGNRPQVGAELRRLIDAGCIATERAGRSVAHHFARWPDRAGDYHGSDL